MMPKLLYVLLQGSGVLCIAVLVSGGLVYLMPKSSANRVYLLPKPIDVNDGGGVAYFTPAQAAAPAQALASTVNLNTAPPRNDKQQFIKVGELGAFMKEARVVRKICKMAQLKAATGLSEQEILSIENGSSVPTPAVANELESVLKIQVEFR